MSYKYLTYQSPLDDRRNEWINITLNFWPQSKNFNYIYNSIGNFFTFLRLTYKIKKPSSIATQGRVSNYWPPQEPVRDLRVAGVTGFRGGGVRPKPAPSSPLHPSLHHTENGAERKGIPVLGRRFPS